MSAQGAGAPALGATDAKSEQQARQGQRHGAGGKAAAAAQEPTEGGLEALLPGSSEDEDAPAPAAPALTAEEATRRKRRREEWEAEQEGSRRWDLARRLAAISTDVEFLAREVERVRAELEVPLPQLSELPEAERLQLETARRKRLTELLGNHCKKTLGHITSHKWSWPFNAPVDLRQYPDYLAVVASPMDFGTVKRRIDAGCASGGATGYRHPDEFLADVRLVFDNARLYNKPGSDVHVMANTLQERFEERYAQAVSPKVAEEAAISRMQHEEAARRHLEASGRSTEVLEQHCAVLIKYIDEVSACILDARSAAAALCKPVSRAEKEALVRALNTMPQEQFEAAVGLVMSHHPGLQAYDDFGFDLDALDALSLRQMQSFVRACEAAAAEARDRGAPPPAGAVSWPQLLLGAGLRPYRPPKGSRRLKRPQQRGQAAVKKEEGGQQQGDMPPPAAGQAGQKRPLAEVVVDAPPPPSTLTPEEVAAAAAAAGMISPLLPPAVLPPAGSAVAPKGLGPAAAAAAGAAGAMPPPAVPAQRQQAAQQAPKQQQQHKPAAATKAAPVVGSNTPVAPLGPLSSAARPDGAAPALQAPTAAQMAAVAASTLQEQQLLSQMHSMLTAAAQAAASSKAAQSGQQPKKK
ncbi:hypothetical protein ABPG75_003806 [Micractinium tetrahymenae]